MTVSSPIALDESRQRQAGRVLAGELAVSGLPSAMQREVLEFLQANKVPLFAVDRDTTDASSELLFPGLRSDVLKPLLEEERAACARQRCAYVEAAGALNAAGIPTVLFKTGGSYPYTSSNVDVLVPAGTMAQAVTVLEGIGFHEMVHYWEPNKRLLRRFCGAECEVMVHLHEKVAWIVLAFLDMPALWSRTRTTCDPAVTHVAPEDLVAALLAHAVYENNKVRLGDVWKVRQAVSEPGFDWGEVVRIAAGRSWLPGLALARYWFGTAERAAFGDSRLLDPAWREGLPALPAAEVAAVDQAVADGWPVRLAKRITKPYFFRKLLRDNRRTPLQKAWDLWGVGRQLTWGRLGMRRRPVPFVALCGIDGSGKTTHADAVRAALNECEIPSRRVWMRGGYSPAVEWLKRILRRSSSAVPDVADRAGKRAVYGRGRTRLIWGWLVTCEQLLQAVVKVRWQRLRGRGLVAERYVPDTLADLTEKFGDPDYPQRLAARVLRWLTPRPDLILLLDLPGDTAFARKSDDFDAVILEERRQVYRHLLSGFPQTVVLDATRPLDDLRHDVVDLVLARVFGRLRRNPLNRQRRDAWE
jgi:thymidylate kinase